MTKHLSRLGDCQYLLTSPTHCTLTNFADHVDTMSHGTINRFLHREHMTPRLVWDNVRSQIVPYEDGCIVFDDSVTDKDFSHKIELVRRQYSGNAHGLIKGIGVVNCLYVNPHSGEDWIIDDRIYDQDGDGKTNLDHVRDMLIHAVHHKALPFRRILMDTWYATKELMLFIESLDKRYYGALRSNRQVDDSEGKSPYRHIDSLDWDAASLAHGKTIKIKGFPKHRQVKLFRVEVSTHRTDWVVTLTLVAQALHWFDVPRFYEEVRRVSRPNALLAAVSYDLRLNITSELDALVRYFYHEVVGPYWAAECKHVKAGYETLSFPFERMPTPTFVLAATWNLPRLLGYLESWSAVAAYRAAPGLDALYPLREKFARAWGDEPEHTVSWPLTI